MTVLHEDEVGGVRAFWVDSGRPTLSASLVFRTGIADEAFTSHGLIHLLEHLALRGRGGGTLHVNGSVAPLVTSFDVHGPVEQVVDHLANLTRWLSDPEFSELPREVKVLRAESAMRGPSAVGDALLWRYGARGPGLVGMAEFGLSTATVDALRALAAESFTRANAVLALDGTPPAALSLDLPWGTGRLPLRHATPCDMPCPGMYEAPALVVTGTTSRSVAATLLPALTENRLRDRLRHADGASYAPWSHYEPVDADTAVVVAGADISPEGVGGVGTVAAEILGALAEDGPSPTELADVVSPTVQAMRDPYNAAGIAWRSAHRWLQGHDPQTLHEVVAETEAVNVDDVRDAAGSLRSSMLIGAPPGADVPAGVSLLARPLRPAQPGTTYRSWNWPADRSRLTVGSDQVRVSNGSDAISIQLGDAVGLVKHADGTRTVVAGDGWNLTLEPVVWQHGDQAVARLDEQIPHHLHVGALVDERHDGPERMPWSRRWWYGTRLALRSTLALAIYLGVLVVLGVFSMSRGFLVGVVAIIFTALGVVRELSSREELRASGQTG